MSDETCTNICVGITINALISAEQKFEKKRELAKRLADINARKREEKLAEDEDQLQKLLVAKDLFDDGDYEEFKEIIDEQSIPNYDELQVTGSLAR